MQESFCIRFNRNDTIFADVAHIQREKLSVDNGMAFKSLIYIPLDIIDLILIAK